MLGVFTPPSGCSEIELNSSTSLKLPIIAADVAVIAPITSASAEQDKGDSTWIVRRGLADKSCVSFESRNNPGDFLRHQNFALRVQPFDGSA
jgi:hypothetical protein